MTPVNFPTKLSFVPMSTWRENIFLERAKIRNHDNSGCIVKAAE